MGLTGIERTGVVSAKKAHVITLSNDIADE
jgi:hypothetical protein